MMSFIQIANLNAFCEKKKYDEKNMVLTDGQKTRVALARALYSSAKILVVDDCLSSLDANTGLYLFILSNFIVSTFL